MNDKPNIPLTEQAMRDFKERMSQPIYIAPIQIPRQYLEAWQKLAEEGKK